MQDDEIIIILIFVFFSGLAYMLFTLRKEKKLREKLSQENSRLIADNALLEAEHLKFQLQPHTLRNMIASLHVASKNLYRGSEALANTLDYVLYNGNKKHLVSIQEEVSFLEIYRELQGNFVNQTDNIIIDKSGINTSSKYYHAECIPHLTMAYFIENAFKHGDIYHPDFLHIRIILADNRFELHVTNRSKPKAKAMVGGVGLTNMQKRLDLLLNSAFEIKTQQTEQEFYSYIKITF